jgi:hypothetical protein
MVGAVGTGPSPTGAALVHLGLWWPRLGVILEARPELGARLDIEGGAVSTQQWLVTAAPCVKVQGFAGCALISAGRFVARGHEVMNARAADAPMLLAGLRLERAFELSRRLALAAHLDANVPLTHVNVLVAQEVVWSAPLAQASAGLQLRVRWP